jgi:hypothetical protein
MHTLHSFIQTLCLSPLLVALLLSTPCLADSVAADVEEPQRFIDVGLGPGVYQITDDVVRGLRWRGPSLEIDGAFRYANQTDHHDVFLRIGATYLENRYDHAAVSIFHHVGYGFSRRVLHAGRWGMLFLGGQIREDVDLQYYIDWDEEHAYWLSSYSLAAAARYGVQVGPRYRFEATFAIPVIGWVSRPAEFHYYKADDLKSSGWLVTKPFEDLSFASFSKYQAAHWSFACTIHPGRGWSLRLVYLLDYRRASFPRPVQILVNTLTAGFVYAY